MVQHLFPNNYDLKNIINEFTEIRNYSLTRLGDEMGIAWSGS